MRIKAFIGAAVLALCSLAFVPATMALDDPPPEICLFDLSKPVALDIAPITSKTSCAFNVADAWFNPASSSGAHGEAAQDVCSIALHSKPVFAAYRHEDPGRCLG